MSNHPNTIELFKEVFGCQPPPAMLEKLKSSKYLSELQAMILANFIKTTENNRALVVKLTTKKSAVIDNEFQIEVKKYLKKIRIKDCVTAEVLISDLKNLAETEGVEFKQCYDLVEHVCSKLNARIDLEKLCFVRAGDSVKASCRVKEIEIETWLLKVGGDIKATDLKKSCKGHINKVRFAVDNLLTVDDLRRWIVVCNKTGKDMNYSEAFEIFVDSACCACDLLVNPESYFTKYYTKRVG